MRPFFAIYIRRIDLAGIWNLALGRDGAPCFACNLARRPSGLSICRKGRVELTEVGPMVSVLQTEAMRLKISLPQTMVKMNWVQELTIAQIQAGISGAFTGKRGWVTEFARSIVIVANGISPIIRLIFLTASSLMEGTRRRL